MATHDGRHCLRSGPHLGALVRMKVVDREFEGVSSERSRSVASTCAPRWLAVLKALWSYGLPQRGRFVPINPHVHRGSNRWKAVLCCRRLKDAVRSEDFRRNHAQPAPGLYVIRAKSRNPHSWRDISWSYTEAHRFLQCYNNHVFGWQATKLQTSAV